MGCNSFRERAERVRPIPLEAVLARRGATKDPRDKSRWHTEQGAISVTGPKFMNWCGDEGGGGAIDLVFDLAGLDFRGAVVWLENQFGIFTSGERTWRGPEPHGRAGDAARGIASGGVVGDAEPRPGRLPQRDDAQLDRMRRYLVDQR
jgi:hypothetical protein